MEQGYLKRLTCRYFPRISQKDFSPFIPWQALRAEWPAGADYEIAIHADLISLVKDNLQHINPFVAQPFERFSVQRVISSRKRDRINLDPTYARFLHDVKFPDKFLGFHPVAIPPPSDEWTVTCVRVLELGIKLFGGQFRLCRYRGHKRYKRQDDCRQEKP